MSERFAIIGAGNGGLAFACYLAARGGEVVAICDKRREWIASLREVGRIRAIGPHLEWTMGVPRLTDEIGEAVGEATVILVVTTANAHEEVARAVAGSLRENQVVVLCPGYLGGSVAFWKGLRAAGCRVDVMVGELTLLPFAARVVDVGVVGIRAIKRWVPCAALRVKDTEELVGRLKEYLPMLAEGKDVLEVGLSNVNPVLHVPGTLLNLGLVDGGWFRERDFYEVFVGRVRRVIEEVDRERVTLARTLGYEVLTMEEFDRKAYEGVERAYIVGRAQGERGEAANVPPRYLEEDVPMGLVPMVEIGEMVGMELRVSRLLVELANVVQGVDYWAVGRRMERLGVRSVEELRGVME
jgi:opine dehydrogenase